LVQGRCVPAGLLPVGGADINLAVDDEGPHQGGRVVGGAIFADGEMYKS
jgi:hypothetical protein